MKHCELCKEVARIYCESDQASLCWTCDAKVHSANFLVARHSRAVLCNSCHSPTPWNSSGSHLAVAVAFCDSCVAGHNGRTDDHDPNRENTTDDEDEEEDTQNQVVPWSPATPPPPASSSSSEDDEDDESSTSYGGGEASESNSFKKRPRKDLVVFTSPKRRRYRSELKTRTSCSTTRSSAESRTILVSQAKQIGSVTESVVEEFRPRDLRNLSGGGSRAVDLNSSESPSRTI